MEGIAPLAGVGLELLGQRRGEVDIVRLRLTGDVDAARRGARRPDGLGADHGDRLSVEPDGVVVERRERLAGNLQLLFRQACLGG